MHYKKIFVFLLIFITVASSYCTGSNDHSKTALIDYLKNRNQDFTTLKKDIKRLEEACSGYYYWRHDYESLCEALRERSKFGSKTLEQVTQLIKQRKPINATDNQGKTALDFANTREIYLKLRAAGADFKLKPFIYCHPKTSITMTVFLISIAYGLYEISYLSSERLRKHREKIKIDNLQSVDELGRTPLMNHLIEQEQALVELRSHIQTLHIDAKTDTDAKNSYYDAIIEYQVLLDETRTNIKTMIDQGAALDIHDDYHKSLLNYCATKDIYNDLRTAGAPFEMKPWLYFDSREDFAINCMLSAAVIAIINIPLVLCTGEML